MNVSRAAALAEELHKGQVDKAGVPYIQHLASVAGRLQLRLPDAPEYVVIAAWLHDALEDTSASPSSLLAAGVARESVSIITEVTRPPRVPYLDWIADLARDGDPWAIRVKLSDNEDNSDPTRVASIPGGEFMVRTRYVPARALLLSGLMAKGGSRK